MTPGIRRYLHTLLAVSLLAMPAVAHAQVTHVPAPGIYPSYTGRNSLAFDPVNNVYMAIVWSPPFGSILSGRFLDKAGNPIGSDFVIAIDDVDGEGNPAWASWPSIAAGGPPNDPAFIVTYHVTLDGSTAVKYARLVRYVGGVASVTPRVMVADVGTQWQVSEKAQSFWNGQQFVVGTRLLLPGFAFPNPTVNLVDMALNVSPNVNLGDGADFYGSPALACGQGICLAFGFKAGVAGNYSGGSYGRLFNALTLAPQGTVIPVSPQGQNEDQAVVYQKHTGMFLTHWFRVAGGWIDTRVVVPDGSLGATNTAAGPNAGMNTFSYNQYTQTTLLTFKDSSATLYAWELGDQGTAIRPNNFLYLTDWDGAINDYLPSIAANEEDGQWLVSWRKAATSFGSVVTGTFVDPTSVPLTIQTNSSLPAATDTLPYAQLMLASGGVIPYTWSLVSGALPPGITLTGAYLNGTPTTPGTYNFRLRVTSTDMQVAERDFTVQVLAIIIAPPGGGGAHITGNSPLYLSFSLGNRNNLAYDSVNGVYLLTVHNPGAGQPVMGRFLNQAGTQIGADFIIADDIDPVTGNVGFLAWAGIAFGGPAGDPTFLVTYHLADSNQVNSLKLARFVRYIGGAPNVSGTISITGIGTEWFASEKAQSLWNGTQWIIGTRLLLPGFSFPTFVVQTLQHTTAAVSSPVNLGDGGDFYGSPALACAANGTCLAVGFKAGIPTGYSGGTYSRRFNGATLAPIGTLVPLAINFPNEDQGVVYQTHTGNFLVQWARGCTAGGDCGPPGGAGRIDTRLVAPDGSMSLLDLNRGIGPGAGTNAFAFNEGTRTTLLVTKTIDANLVVMELGDDGYPLDPSNTVLVTGWDGSINDFYPSIAANHSGRQWLVTARLSSGTHGKVIQGSPTGPSYPVQNWTFADGVASWGSFAQPNPSDLVMGVSNGVLHFYREPSSTQGVVLQSLGVGFAGGAPIAADFDIGNSSTVRKRIAVLLHDADFSDLAFCTFWLEPGAPLRTYRIRAHTTEAWTNATIAFYAATAGFDGGYYRLDNIEVYSLPGQAVDRTECVDPTTPGPIAEPDGPTMLVNGDFNTGQLTPWGTFGQITYQIVGGVFQFERPAAEPAGVVLQGTGVPLANGTRLTATFSLGNSSGVRRRVTILVHDGDFLDLNACTFWLPAGQPLLPYQMKLFTTKAWANATLSVYPANVDASPSLLLDDVALRTSPSGPLFGTECVEPPPGLPPGSLTATSAAGADPPPASGGWSFSRRPERETASWQAVVGESGTQAFLWARPIDLREADGAALRFESQLSRGESEAFVEVTRDGVNWLRVAEIPPSEHWSAMSVDLAAFSGNVIYVRFVYAGVEPVGGVPVEAWSIRGIHVGGRVPRTIQRFR